MQLLRIEERANAKRAKTRRIEHRAVFNGLHERPLFALTETGMASSSLNTVTADSYLWRVGQSAEGRCVEACGLFEVRRRRS